MYVFTKNKSKSISLNSIIYLVTPCETMKPLRTKIIFIIDSLPHYVRN